jgi:hypothetical protein
MITTASTVVAHRSVASTVVIDPNRNRLSVAALWSASPVRRTPPAMPP